MPNVEARGASVSGAEATQSLASTMQRIRAKFAKNFGQIF